MSLIFPASLLKSGDTMSVSFSIDVLMASAAITNPMQTIKIAHSIFFALSCLFSLQFLIHYFLFSLHIVALLFLSKIK